MSRLAQYHILTLSPILVLCFLLAFKFIGNGLFAILFLLYAFIFRPIVDYKKLKRKGLVNRKIFIKSLGFVRFKYYTELMFEE
jgi:hypothetical protein